MTAAKFIKRDSATRGSWVGVYGNQGYHVPGDSDSLPSYLSSYGETGFGYFVWEDPSVRPDAIQKPSNHAVKFAAALYTISGPGTWTLSFTDDNWHQIALYVYDPDATAIRNGTIRVSDNVTGEILGQEYYAPHDADQGQYSVWLVRGNIKIDAIYNGSGANFTISGWFLDSQSLLAGPPTTKTVKPDGTGDYTTLDAWWDWAQTQTGDVAAECYGGDLKFISHTGVGPNDGSCDHIRIYAAASAKHNGVLDTTKAYFNLGSQSFDFARSRMTIEGIQFIRFDTIHYSGRSMNLASDVTLRKNLILDLATVDNASIWLKPRDVDAIALFENNVLYKVGSTSAAEILEVENNSTIRNTILKLDNNTLYSPAGKISDHHTVSGGAAPILNARNNIFLGLTSITSPTSLFTNTNGLTIGVVDYNLYSSTSGLAGTHNLTTSTAAVNFVTPGSTFSLKTGSPAINAGLTVLTIVDDILNVSRPQFTAYDIGAFEVPDPTNNPNDRYYDEVIVDRPLAYYREADNSALMADSSGHNNNGTHNTSVIKGQSSLLYRNTNQSVFYTQFGNSTFPDILKGSTYTFEFWYIHTQQVEGKIFSVNNSYGFFEPVNDSSGRARFSFGGKWVDAKDRPQLGKIYYVVCIIDNGKLDLFINDVFQGTASGAYKLFRLHGVTGPFHNEALYLTTGTFSINNFDWIAAGSAQDAVFQNITGIATVRETGVSYSFPGPAFRWGDSQNRIYFEDLYGLDGCDYDFDDDYWLVDIERVNDSTGNNQLGVGFIGRLDEVAIYDYRLTADRQTKHYQTGKFPDIANGYALVDTLSPIDTLGYQLILTRAITDTLTITDFSGKARSLTEQINIVDIVKVIHNGKLTSTEILEVKDATDVLVIGATLKQFQHVDLLRITDFAKVDKVKALVDILVVTDSVKTPGLYFDSLKSTIVINDTVTFLITGKIFRNLTDILTVFDSVVITSPQKSFQLRDNLFVSDSLSFTGPKRIKINDIVPITDFARINLQKFTVKDTIFPIDFARINLHRESLIDNLTLVEKLRVSPIKLALKDQVIPIDTAKFFLNHLYLMDQITITEFVNVHYGILNVPLIDQVTVTDSLFLRWGRFNGNIVDTLTVVDSLKRIQNFAFNDILTITDSVIRVHPFTITDALTLVDNLVYLKVKALFDQLQVIDSVCICYSGSRTLVDTLTVLDTVFFRLNGQNNQAGNGDRDHTTIKQVLKLKLTDTIEIKDFVRLPRVVDGCCMGTLSDKLVLHDILGATQVHSGVTTIIPVFIPP